MELREPAEIPLSMERFEDRHRFVLVKSSLSQQISLFALAKILNSTIHPHIVGAYASLSFWSISSEFHLQRPLLQNVLPQTGPSISDVVATNSLRQTGTVSHSKHTTSN